MASPLPPSPVGVHVRAPAKINLALKVGAPRADGYHPLATVYQAVSLYDEVHAWITSSGRTSVGPPREIWHNSPSDPEPLRLTISWPYASV